VRGADKGLKTNESGQLPAPSSIAPALPEIKLAGDFLVTLEL
jgi:hypothetical protein